VWRGPKLPLPAPPNRRVGRTRTCHRRHRPELDECLSHVRQPRSSAWGYPRPCIIPLWRAPFWRTGISAYGLADGRHLALVPVSRSAGNALLLRAAARGDGQPVAG
jgi:hypothetical protein